ncbi:MAG: methyl-accepting chemotaxis protein, partial [Stenotrophomonas sp.]
EQVSQTVMQMDETTQQNAALVEEATAAARAMEEQARHLSTAVAAFRLDEGQAAGTPAPAARRPAAAAVAAAPARSPARPALPARAPALAAVNDNDGDWQEF